MTKVTKQDMLLWQAFTHNIKPLKKNNVISMSLKTICSPLKQTSRPPDLTIFTSPEKSFSPLQLNRRELRRFNAESTIDLHGLTRLEAFDVLLDFLKCSYSTHKRHVKIITGKGDPLNPYTLRHEVKKWLCIAPFTSLVLAYHEAKPKDGGKGALYIQLRKAPIKLQNKF